MRIVHVKNVEEVKPSVPTKRKKDLSSGRRWAAIQRESNYRKSLVEFQERIKAIQQVHPGWVPQKRADSL